MTDGAIQLREICELHTQRAVAAAIGVTQQAVSGWLSGRSIPKVPQALLLEELYDLEIKSWL